MAQVAVCEGYIHASSDPELTAPFYCWASPRGGYPIPFTIVDCPSTGCIPSSESSSDLSPSFTSGVGVFDLVFVGLLFIAFCAGFHKGGQR